MDNYIYRIGSPTNILGRPPNFYRSSELLSKQCAFASVYAVTVETAYAIETISQTAQGFKGVVWSQRLWVDFDNEEAGKAAQIKLKELGYDYVVYHTGGRGIHIGILRDTQPCHTLPQQDKAWVSTNLAGADLSLYWHLHLIRLPGTKHERTGIPKTLIVSQRGRSLQLPILSQEERSEMGRITEQMKQGSIFTSFEVVSNLAPTGDRKQLVRLAAALKEHTEASLQEALWVIKEVNRGFNPPRDEKEVERIVRWAYNEI